MAGKRLVVIGLLVFAALTAAPRPASAQWIDFMKWLESLDPGPFPGVGGGISLACYDPGAAKDSKWTGATCGGDKLGKLLSKRGISADQQNRSLDGVKVVFGAQLAYGFGDNNLDPANLQKNVRFFETSWNTAFRVSRAVDVGISLGNVNFHGSPKSVNAFKIEPFIDARPLVDLVKGCNQWCRGLAVRLSVPMLPQGFVPEDFGYPHDPTSKMVGKREVLPSFAIMFGVPIPK